jgi:glutaconate CoA-transferase subunit A
VPWGSYPHEYYGLYDSEPGHFGEYVAGIQAHGAAGVERYLERYVYAPEAHADYLALFPDAMRADAERRGRELCS